MKRIKELGLELIQLDDQIVLVDNKLPVFSDEWALSSTKQLEGLPLLVIEDEVDENVRNRNFQKQVMNPYPVESYSYTAYEKGFIEGYDKSTEFHKRTKETYKFTEEDIWYIVDLFIKKVPDAIDVRKEIENLTKKELFIEIEDKIAIDGHTIIGIEPKITDGKIKAIWK